MRVAIGNKYTALILTAAPAFEGFKVILLIGLGSFATVIPNAIAFGVLGVDWTVINQRRRR